MAYSITTATRKVARLKKRIRALPGGTSAGKTIGVLQVLIALAQQDTKPTITSIVSESLPHLKRGAIRDFLDILQQHNYFDDKRWNKSDYSYKFETGSVIEFFGVEESRKVRGPRRDRLFVNEANRISFDTFEQLEIRTREFIFLDWNPSEEFWYYTDFKGKRDDVEELTLTYLDNEALEPAIVATIEQRKHRAGWWKVFGLGQLGEVEGKIYSGWQIIDQIPFEARLERYGVDFGYSNDPTAIVAVYYYNGGYIFDEICYETGLMNPHIADILANLPRKLVIADVAEPKSIAEIRSFGFNILRGMTGKDAKRYGIKVMQNEKISVTRNSANLLREYRNYLWKMDKEGAILMEAEDGNDHALDAARYAMSSLIPVIRRDDYIRSLPVRHFQQKPINPAR